ncbi:MAG TPA: rRNA maturation RNase YbeY [Candidatus Micrarchaeia archaeon]|nr:rRNA maturation RNase YbeY [Candidatus Micrarchaeia archaeon]
MIQTVPSLAVSARTAVARAQLAGLLGRCLRSLGRSGWRVTCRCADDRELRALSRAFLGEDRPTDVLAFPTRQDGGGPAHGSILGDLAISVERAISQAEVADRPPEDELRLLAVHGLLHLCGHDHDTAARALAMTRATRRLLAADAARRDAAAPAVPALVPPATVGADEQRPVAAGADPG